MYGVSNTHRVVSISRWIELSDTIKLCDDRRLINNNNLETQFIYFFKA